MRMRLRSLLVLVGLFAILAAPVCAAPGKNYGWDVPNSVPDAVTAQSYVYTFYADGNPIGTVATGVTCVSAGTPPVITCKTLGATLNVAMGLTNGPHNISLTMATANGLESPQSVISTFTVFINGPNNFRVVQ